MTRREFLRQVAGFTFIELLVTTAVLMVLASAALPLARVTMKRQRESELRTSLNRVNEHIDQVEREVVARDRELDNPFTKDSQITAIHGARRYLADRITRVAAPHKLLDPAAGPLIAVKLHILTRKTLGGLHTDLSARVLRADGEPLPGLYAAGEAAGFGGGGMHGYRSLEGTFLGGCLFSGRTAGRAIAADLR